MEVDIKELMYDIRREVGTDTDIVSEMHDEYIQEMIGYCDTEYIEVLALKVTYFLLDKHYIEECDVGETYKLIINKWIQTTHNS